MSAAATEEAAAVEDRITDEDIERAKAQIGIAVNKKEEPWHTVISADTITHFAFGIGDDNPLFLDSAYVSQHALARPDRVADLPGNHRARPETEIHRPRAKEVDPQLVPRHGQVLLGREVDVVTAGLCGPAGAHGGRYALDVQVTESEFAGGRSVKETYRYLYVDIHGNPIATRDESYISAERQGSKNSGKYSSIERQHWTEEEFADVEEAYEAEVRRGAEPQWWEDVAVGDELPQVMKGPLTTVDIISMHVGWGWGDYGVGPLKSTH